jgi:hypothetical protein
VVDDAREPQRDRERGAADAGEGDAPGGTPLTIKERGGVQRALDQLLDALVPDRAVARAAQPALPIERHRTPRGCVLQAPTAAVSVSWYAETASDAVFGELQVVVWRGVVSQPGSARRAPGGARIVREMTLHPEAAELRVEGAPVEWLWRAGDGTRYDADTLAAHCLAMLEQETRAGAPDGGAC